MKIKEQIVWVYLNQKLIFYFENNAGIFKQFPKSRDLF